MSQSEQRLAECLRLLDETGDMDRCLREYPDQETELRSYLAISSKLSMPLSAQPDPAAQVQSRRLVLSSLQTETRGQKMVPWLSGKLAALLSVGAFMAAGTLGVAAADGVGGRGPINDVLSSLGVVPGNSASPLVEGGQGSSTGNHGSHVSSAVHRAIASTTPGPGRGIAVSQAACEAAHDRTTLPQGAQNAPGQAKKTATPKSCVHPNADGTPGNGASAQATPTPTTIVTTTVATDTEPATEEEPSSPGRSGEEHGKPENPGNRGNSNAGAAPAGTPVAGPGQSSNAPGHSNQPSNAGGSSNAGGGNAGGSNAGGPPQSPPGRPSTLPNSSGGQGGQGQGQGGQNQGGQGGGGQGNRR